MILSEIKRLRLEVCLNMGKAKVKKYLDIFCGERNLPICSESKVGRIIKDKKIYHQRRKFYHNGKIKTVERKTKLRKPKGFAAKNWILNLTSPVDYLLKNNFVPNMCWTNTMG